MVAVTKSTTTAPVAEGRRDTCSTVDTASADVFCIGMSKQEINSTADNYKQKKVNFLPRILSSFSSDTTQQSIPVRSRGINLFSSADHDEQNELHSVMQPSNATFSVLFSFSLSTNICVCKVLSLDRT